MIMTNFSDTNIEQLCKTIEINLKKFKNCENKKSFDAKMYVKRIAMSSNQLFAEIEGMRQKIKK